jgi:hypothetical protein
MPRSDSSPPPRLINDGLWTLIEPLISPRPPAADGRTGRPRIDDCGGPEVGFLCRDSVLAALLVIELARLIDLAARRGSGGARPATAGWSASNPPARATGPMVGRAMAVLPAARPSRTT